MQISFFCIFELYTKGQCRSCNLDSKLLFCDHQNVSYDQSSTPALLNMSAILAFGGHLENGRIRSGQESFCNLHYLENIWCKFHACIIN